MQLSDSIDYIYFFQGISPCGMLDVTNPNATGWMVKRVKETLEELEGDLNKGLVAKTFFHSRFWGRLSFPFRGIQRGGGSKLHCVIEGESQSTF